MTKKSDTTRFNSNRRTAIKRIGALAGASGATQLMPGFMAYAYGSDEPIKVGMQLHRTGIGASYGRWYERVATATAKLINEEGGINGRPLSLLLRMMALIQNAARRWWRNSLPCIRWMLPTVPCSLMWLSVHPPVPVNSSCLITWFQKGIMWPPANSIVMCFNPVSRMLSPR